ncbi:MAG: recombinase family protein [Elainellaceae cyanobacterium]
MALNIAGYIRVSTHEQATDSLSLQRQRELVEQNGATFIFEEVETASKRKKRPKLEALLDLVKGKKIDLVITPRLDRIARSSRELHRILGIIEDAGARIQFLDYPAIDPNTPEGLMLIAALSMVAEMESKNLSERGKSEKRHRRKNQCANSVAPLGYGTEKNQYKLDREPFLCLISEDRPKEPGIEFEGRNLNDVLKEVIHTFILTKSARATLDKIFNKYGVRRMKGKRGGLKRAFSWSLDGFINWIKNPVLQGHTFYLPGVSKVNTELSDPDKTTLIQNSHSSERLISPQDWLNILEAIETSRRIGSDYEKDSKSDQVYSQYAYLNGLVYCHECHARCTPKTAKKGKYQYFSCRYAGASCINRGSAPKSEVEMRLCQELVRASQIMREEAMDARSTRVSLQYLCLAARGASQAEFQKVAATTHPQFKYWKDPSGWQVQSNLEGLRESRQQLELIAKPHHSIQEAKKKLDKEIAEEERRERSALDKTAAEIIFNGKNLIFWQTLSNDDKVSIYSKVVDRIYIKDGEVVQINLRTEPESEVKELWTMSSQSSDVIINASS